MDTAIRPERRLLFIRNWPQWELARKHIFERLSRYGFLDQDRICVSVAIDEAMILALEQTRNGHSNAIAIAYSANTNTFRARIHLVGGAAATLRSTDDRDRWLLAAACMSGLHVDNEAADIEMWRNNSAIAPVEHDGTSRQ